MVTKILGDLHLYTIVDKKQMKVIDVEYNVRVGYWASKNNVQEYKVYAVVIQMFDLDFMNNLRQAPKDNLWSIEQTNQNYRTHLLHQA
jgi:hypothetical protein